MTHSLTVVLWWLLHTGESWMEVQGQTVPVQRPPARCFPVTQQKVLLLLALPNTPRPSEIQLGQRLQLRSAQGHHNAELPQELARLPSTALPLTQFIQLDISLCGSFQIPYILDYISSILIFCFKNAFIWSLIAKAQCICQSSWHS